jgi:hypothetical protein
MNENKEKYEKPEITDQEKLDATSGANDMLPYDPYLPFTPYPYTGGNEASFTGPVVVVLGALVAAGSSVAGWLFRRGARESSKHEDR